MHLLFLIIYMHTKILNFSTAVRKNWKTTVKCYNYGMIFYHGSKQVIESPKEKGSKPYNDYGPSFYLTHDLESAMLWACKHDNIGIVNKYEIRNNVFNELKILDLTNKEKYSVLNWLAILVHFKDLESLFKTDNKEALEWLSKFYIDVNEYDVVIGFRADDSYWLFPEAFINGAISIDELEMIYKLGDLGIQQAFMSERAVKALKFKGVIECDETYVGKYYERVKEANKVINSILHKGRSASKKYIFDLMRADYGK